MKKRKIGVVIALCLVGVMALTGCGKTKDVKPDKILNVATNSIATQDFKEYKELTGGKGADLEKILDNSLDLSKAKDNEKESVKKVAKAIFSNVKYKVVDTEKVDDGYKLSVDVEPLNIKWDKDKQDKAMEKIVDEVSAKDKDFMEKATAKAMEYYTKDITEKPKYEEKTNIKVTVKTDKDGHLFMEDMDMIKFIDSLTTGRI